MTPPDPANVRIPGMIDDQQHNTVFLKPLVNSPKIEIGEYTFHNDADDASAFETRNVLYTAGPERLIIGRFCAIATGARYRLLRIAWWNWPIEMITDHVRTIWAGTPAELDQVAESVGLLW
jgi:virginiamycin A acetyltransferase